MLSVVGEQIRCMDEKSPNKSPNAPIMATINGPKNVSKVCIVEYIFLIGEFHPCSVLKWGGLFRMIPVCIVTKEETEWAWGTLPIFFRPSHHHMPRRRRRRRKRTKTDLGHISHAKLADSTLPSPPQKKRKKGRKIRGKRLTIKIGKNP